jgi:glycosyltransferase involved in cell wall biosynthesis
VTVRRFANSRTRDIKSFNQYSDWIFHNEHSRDDEMRWLEEQGPWSPALMDYLSRHHEAYDALIFFTYLYSPTVLGLGLDPARSILVPTAHDEPAIKLRLYRDLFRKAKAIAYNTDVERRFLNSTFDIRATAEATVGCGVDLPQNRPHPGTPEAAEAAASDDENSPDKGYGNRRRMRGRGEAFRRRHRLHGPVALYGGRIDPGKGCEELLQYFNGYQRAGGDAMLVLMGAKLMPLPEDPSVRFAGMLSEAERAEALEAATVVVVPSPHESLSLLALEAMAVGTPILVNGRSDVLVDHCRKSQAGLYYSSEDEFTEALKMLLADDRLRAQMGRNGRQYVKTNYRWDVIMQKYDGLMAALKG